MEHNIMDSLIGETRWEIEEVFEYIKQCCLNDKLSICNTTPNQLCMDCVRFLKNDLLSLDEITELFVIVSMLYFIQTTTEDRELRLYTLEKSFRAIDTLSPIHIHIITKRMWHGLKRDDPRSIYNIMNICRKIAVANETGRAVAISLMWTILGELTNNPSKLYCFRPFSELPKILANLPVDTSDNTELLHKKSQDVYIAMQATSFLIANIVFNRNEDFCNTGYRPYFSYSSKDLANLKQLVTKILESTLLQPTVSFYKTPMQISQYINFNIIGVLFDKITESSFGI